jgi:ABC-type sugar transport system permease subunit
MDGRREGADQQQQEGEGLIVLRVIGWLLILAALILLGRDIVAWIHLGRWVAMPAGQLWHDLSPNSLGLAQAAIERHVWKPLWNPVIFTILRQPASLVFAAPGLLLLLVARRSRRRRRFLR